MSAAADGGKRGTPVDSRSVDTRSSGQRPASHPLSLPVRIRVLPLLAGALLALAAVSPVLGHAELVSSDPADKAVLETPPTLITLTFDEGVVGKSSFKLIGPGGETVGTGGPAKDGDDTMTLDGLALAPGAYTIEWTSVADDGDVERGTLSFTVTEPTPAPATPTPAPSRASAAPSVSPSPTPAPSPSADPEPAASSSDTDVLFPIVAALALIGVIGALLLRRNRAA
jgi:copper resistance protein C